MVVLSILTMESMTQSRATFSSTDVYKRELIVQSRWFILDEMCSTEPQTFVNL